MVLCINKYKINMVEQRWKQQAVIQNIFWTCTKFITCSLQKQTFFTEI